MITRITIEEILCPTHLKTRINDFLEELKSPKGFRDINEIHIVRRIVSEKCHICKKDTNFILLVTMRLKPESRKIEK